MKIVYPEEVKAMLRASGMTDDQIRTNELKATLATEALLRKPMAEPDPESNMAKKYASSPLEPMADYSN